MLVSRGLLYPLVHQLAYPPPGGHQLGGVILGGGVHVGTVRRA